MTKYNPTQNIRRSLKLSVLALVAGSALWLSGCAGVENDVHPEKTYRVVEIDGCEYVFISRRPFDSSMAMAHKGDCENPIHHWNGGKHD